MPYKLSIHKNSEKGIGLIETIAALGLAIVVITSLVSLSVYTLRSSGRGKLLLRGSKSANEQLELVRAYRDSRSWTEFVTAVNNSNCTNTNDCYMSVDSSYNLVMNSGVFTEEAGTVNELAYSFSVTDPVQEAGDNTNTISIADPVLRINIEVTWRVGNDPQSSHIFTDVSNWRSE